VDEIVRSLNLLAHRLFIFLRRVNVFDRRVAIFVGRVYFMRRRAAVSFAASARSPDATIFSTVDWIFSAGASSSCDNATTILPTRSVFP
jgi:hypothetical protein